MIHKQYRVSSYDSDLVISSYGMISIQKMTNYDEWADDCEDEIRANRVELAQIHMGCSHNIENLMEVLKLVLVDVKAREKNVEETCRQAKAKEKAKAEKKANKKKKATRGKGK